MDTSGTRWLSADEQVTWRAFFGACRAFYAAIDAQLQRDTGIPLAYYEILVQLSEAPEHTLRMTQLAEAASASKSRVSHAVARLEDKGWIRRNDCPTDRRGQLAELTDEGAIGERLFEGVEIRPLDILDEREFEHLLRRGVLDDDGHLP